MPRPLAFDRDHALDAAVEVFWRRGWADTSVRDLGDAMGIGPSSLYATFGSKAELFDAALTRYVTRLDLGDPSPDAVRAYFRGVTAERQPKGCLLMMSAMAVDGLPPPAAETVRQNIGRLRRWLSAGLADAHKGEQALTVAMGLQAQHRLAIDGLSDQAEQWLGHWLASNEG